MQRTFLALLVLAPLLAAPSPSCDTPTLLATNDGVLFTTMELSDGTRIMARVRRVAAGECSRAPYSAAASEAWLRLCVPAAPYCNPDDLWISEGGESWCCGDTARLEETDACDAP